MSIDEIAMRELAAELGLQVWLSYPNFVSVYTIVKITVVRQASDWHPEDSRIATLATLETVDGVIDWLANYAY